MLILSLQLLHSLDEDDKSQGQNSQDSPTFNKNLIQNDKESQQRYNNSPTESPRSHPTSINLNTVSAHEPNGTVRTPLSPLKNYIEDTAILKMLSDKHLTGEGGEKISSPANSSAEERTNLLHQSDEIS